MAKNQNYPATDPSIRPVFTRPNMNTTAFQETIWGRYYPYGSGVWNKTGDANWFDYPITLNTSYLEDTSFTISVDRIYRTDSILKTIVVEFDIQGTTYTSPCTQHFARVTLNGSAITDSFKQTGDLGDKITFFHYLASIPVIDPNIPQVIGIQLQGNNSGDNVDTIKNLVISGIYERR
jgi:hypothetical protein